MTIYAKVYLSAVNSLHQYFGYEVDFRMYFVKLFLAGPGRIGHGLNVPIAPLTVQQL